MASVFGVVSIERGPVVDRWHVTRDGKTFLQVDVMMKAPGVVSVAVVPLPHKRPVSERDVVSMDRDEGHAAFYAATLRYDRVAAGDPAFPAITVEDWRDIENALDVEHALDVE